MTGDVVPESSIDTVDGWEIMHHQKDGWNPLNHGMFTIYQVVTRISQPTTIGFVIFIHPAMDRVSP